MLNSSVPSILQKIIDTKKVEITQLEQDISFETIKAQAQTKLAKGNNQRYGFANMLRTKQQNRQLGIIAEIKQASPSKGIINHDFDPALFAKQYEQAGAACLSVLTDQDYFKGHNRYLIAARQSCNLPILRKDFMIDPYQIYESYLLGADCILLIMACLDGETVQDLHEIACTLGMDVLIEIHTAEELKRALQLPDLSHSIGGHNIYGINNRDLNTFKTDLNTSLKLKSMLEKVLLQKQATEQLSSLIVSESGIHNSSDIQLMFDKGISNFLIGEQFMKTDHPGHALQSLIASVPISA